MYVVARDDQVDPATVSEIARRLEEGFLPIINVIPGFVSYTVIDRGGGTIESIGFFEDKAAADASTARAAGWVRENLATLLPTPPRVIEGEVMYHDVNAGPRPAYTVARIYVGVEQKNIPEIVTRVREGLVPILRGVPGYVSYVGVDLGEGRIGSLGEWTDRAASEEATRRAVDWVRTNLGSAHPEPTIGASRDDPGAPAERVTVEDLLAGENDTVVARLTYRGTDIGGFVKGYPPTGKPFAFTAIYIWRLATGKLAELWQEADQVRLMRQLGLLSP